MSLHRRAHYVYWHLDADGNCLYVGMSANVKRRNADHRIVSPWWSLVADVLTTTALSRQGAMLFEIEEIQRLAPPHNRQVTKRSVAGVIKQPA